MIRHEFNTHAFTQGSGKLLIISSLLPYAMIDMHRT